METKNKQRTILLQSNDKKDWLAISIKVMTLISIISALLGVGYQKGLIEGIGLGQLNTNLDVQEILFSASMAFLAIYEKISNAFTLNSSNWWVVLVYSMFFLIVFNIVTYIKRNEEKSSDFNDKYVQNFSKKIINFIFKRYIHSTLFSILFSVFNFLVGFYILRAFFALIMICVFPTVFGYLEGASKASDLMKNPPCKPISQKSLKGDFINQCTVIEVDEKVIEGRVIIENKQGYFIQTRDAFLYLSRDRKYCFSSKYETTDSWKERNERDVLNGTFLPSIIDGMCKTNSEKTKSLKLEKHVSIGN